MLVGSIVGDGDGTNVGKAEGDAEGNSVGMAVGVNVGTALGAGVGAREMHCVYHWFGAVGLKSTHSSPLPHSTPTHGSHVSHRTGHTENIPSTSQTVPDELSKITRSGQNDASLLPLHPGSGVCVGADVG